MNVRPAEMGQPGLKMGPAAPESVPSSTSVTARDPLFKAGALPLLALAIAVAATLVWNGFLVWKVAGLVFSWAGF